MIANVLSIAGTDPSGGAGIQADLKTFAALGVYGMAVVTAVVAQNTCEVRRVQVLPADLVAAQLDAVFDDVRVDAVKLGMLADATIVRAVTACLRRRRPPHVVFDPVMASSSGGALMAPPALQVLREQLLPCVDLLTPNLAEAAALLDAPCAGDLDAMRGQARRLRALGPRWVLLKGGHLGGAQSPDLLLGPDTEQVLRAPRIATGAGHGTGCTLSSAVAALLPHAPMPVAVARAKRYLSGALQAAAGLDVGHGRGPLHHGHAGRVPDDAMLNGGDRRR